MNGTMLVTVSMQDGERLPGAICNATSPEIQGSRTSITAQNGEAIFRELPPGAYQLVVEMEGFNNFTCKGIDIRIEETTSVEATLTLASVTEG